ncbi:hypothetical protein ACPZ19_43275 [Amycolatopsis lurida]
MSLGNHTEPEAHILFELGLDHQPRGHGHVAAVGRILKIGRAILVVGVDFTADGDPLAMATASFMPAPDATLTLSAVDASLHRHRPDAETHGGLIALAVEEAALSLEPGTTLLSLAMRYLRPARVGPLVATATRRGALARVDVRDSGNDHRLAVAATTRRAGT